MTSDHQGVILLVDDNPDDVDLTIRALRQNNIRNEIVVAHDGVEAIDLLFGRADVDPPVAPLRPILTLLDLKLPRIDGHEVLHRLRSHPDTRSLPVVVLTTSQEDRDILTSYDEGANSYVRKPVDFKAFSETVRSLGLYWLLVNQALPPKDHVT